MSVRTYNPSVRVGNWNEDIQLEEDLLKDFLERREKGQLQIQKSSNLGLMTSKVSLSISRDGYVHFGDVITLRCPEAADRTIVSTEDLPRDECALAINMPASQLYEGTKLEGPCGVSGTKRTEPCARTAFVIESVDATPVGHPLRFGQPFNLRTSTSDGYYLHSDRASFQKAAKKSRHQEVSLVRTPSFLSQWQILYFDPRLRMEFEGSPVPANERVIFNHVRTNQNLAVEQHQTLRTPFDREYELSAHTFRDSHKAEMDVNHWIITTGAPGEEICPPAEDAGNGQTN